MLHVTRDAAVLVQRLVAEADLPEAGGLRIDANRNHPGLCMQTAVARQAGDAVVTQYGARLFLSPPAVREMATGTLHAETTPEGSVFYLDR